MVSNLARRRRALKALEGYDNEITADIVDLVTDLRHLAEAEGVDFDDVIRISESHFEAEITEENET